MCRFIGSAVVAASLILVPASKLIAQVGYEKAPINYAQAQPSDSVQKLIEAIESGRVKLEYSSEHGWLPSVLEQLNISTESQLLVFSKTSLQLHKISPRTPRALYFNDEVYVGWCQRGDVLEIAATDPNLGAVFYTIDQNDAEAVKIQRDRGGCLTCHATHRTQGVPGFLVRSIYPDNSGRPRTGTRTFVTDHTSPFEQRFGGWYVSGEHGAMRHMGNLIARDRSDPESMDRELGANAADLSEFCDTAPYLTDHSDIVALMLLEHQSQMHNFIARASMEARIASYYDRGINEALDRPLDTVSPSTQRRIAAAGEKLVRYMLFADEIPLTNSISGHSGFVEQFQSNQLHAAQFDSQGRSLRELDLQTRLLKYPCSYLIHSDAFDALPESMAKFVRDRLKEVLTSSESTEGFEHLSNADRANIISILSETKPGYIDSRTIEPAT